MWIDSIDQTIASLDIKLFIALDDDAQLLEIRLLFLIKYKYWYEKQTKLPKYQIS